MWNLGINLYLKKWPLTLVHLQLKKKSEIFFAPLRRQWCQSSSWSPWACASSSGTTISPNACCQHSSSLRVQVSWYRSSRAGDREEVWHHCRQPMWSGAWKISDFFLAACEHQRQRSVRFYINLYIDLYFYIIIYFSVLV